MLINTDLLVLVTEQGKISISTARQTEALKEARKKACQAAGMVVRMVESTIEWRMDGEQSTTKKKKSTYHRERLFLKHNRTDL